MTIWETPNHKSQIPNHKSQNCHIVKLSNCRIAELSHQQIISHPQNPAGRQNAR